MDRIFLALIVSGLLLAATSMSLLVATGGGTTVAELKVPPSAVIAPRVTPRMEDKPRMRDNTTMASDDSAR